MKQVLVTVAEELRAAVIQMIVDDPKLKGIARYLASIEIFWSADIDTACAGHGFIFFNHDFWNKLPKETRATIIAHEVWHLILKHLDRGVGSDPDCYNIAADHVINLQLVIEGFTFDFGDMDFVPYMDINYEDMSTEEIYDIIYEKKKNPPPSSGPSKPGKGKPTHVSKTMIEDLVKAAADAIAGNDDYGNVPKQKTKNDNDLDDLTESLGGASGTKNIVLEVTRRSIAIIGATYEEIFKDYLIDPISNAKRSFMRPNRRMHGIKGAVFQLPGRVVRNIKTNRLTHLIYALDVSGSINAETAQTFHDSVATIKRLLNPKLLTVLFFDTRIKLIKTFTDNQAYTKITVEAGGCTSLDEVYKYGRKEETNAMIIFTDLAVIIPPKPSWHTIWLVPERHREANVPNLYGDIYIIPKQEES